MCLKDQLIYHINSLEYLQKQTRITVYTQEITRIKTLYKGSILIYNVSMGTRKIKKSYISSTGYFASNKNKKQIAFESTLERDFYTLLEFDSSVLSYEEQPLTIKYKYLDGNTRKYTPDALVRYVDGTKKLFEVKYANELNNNLELVEKLDLLRDIFFNNKGQIFEIFTDENINKTILKNYNFLYKFSSIIKSTEKTLLVEKTIKKYRNLSIKELLSKLADTKQDELLFIPYIWNYLYKHLHLIEHTLDKKLTMSTTIGTGG